MQRLLPRRAFGRALLAIAIILVGLAPAGVAWSQDPPPPKRVLMLYGHDPNAPGVVAFTNELHAIVRADSPTRVVFYDELLDLDRFPENARREELVNYIVEKYRGFSFDAILTDGTRALKFATERVSARFPSVPIVYGLAFEPEIDFSALPENVTGRHHLLPFAATLELARALQPDAERVVLVAGSSPTDSLLLATAVRDVTPLLGGMQLVVWQDWTYASLLQSMRTLPPRTITILSGFSRDRSGQHFNAGDLIASVTRLASAPVYGIARNWVGDGIVGGVTMDFGDDGMRTGRLLLQVLDRASGGLPLPPSEVARPAQVVDWRALERWGLSEGQLPPGTEVLFRTPTVWDRYKAIHPCRSRPPDRAVSTDCGAAHSTGATAPCRSRAAPKPGQSPYQLRADPPPRVANAQGAGDRAFADRARTARRHQPAAGAADHGSRQGGRSPILAKSSGSPPRHGRALRRLPEACTTCRTACIRPCSG